MATTTARILGSMLSGIEHNRQVILPEGFTASEQCFYRVHFRLETPTYRQASSAYPHFDPPELGDAFYNDACAFLTALGFHFKDANVPAHCKTNAFIGDHGKLHIHPDDFAGALEHHNIERIHAALENRKGTFASRGWTDVYEALEIISQEELATRLTLSEHTIKERILVKFKTTRRNKFCHVGSWSLFVDRLPGFSFLCPEKLYPVIEKHIQALVDDLVLDGRLIHTVFENKPYYRAANATELKKIKPNKNAVSFIPGRLPLMASE